MKLVIDIPYTMYDWLKNGFPDETDGEIAVKAIQDGTPLPDTNVGDMDCIKDSTTDSSTTDSDSTTVEPERKTGKWIPVYDDNGRCSDFRCSACNGADEYGSKFCPNCGAKMEVDDAINLKIGDYQHEKSDNN